MNPTELTRRREALGLSRAELAKRVGVSMPTVWRWETEGRQPIATVERVLEQTLTRLEKRKQAAAPPPAGRPATSKRPPGGGLAHALEQAERERRADNLTEAERWEQIAARIAADIAAE